MNILVLGGTGAMGVHLVNLLASAGNSVFVTTRSKRKGSQNVTYFQGNAKDFLFISSLLERRWDLIIDFMVYSSPEFRERYTMYLRSTGLYIFLSTARVFASSMTQISESSPRLLDVCQDLEYLKTDEYGLSKARQEDMLLSADSKNWLVIRPYITFSENRLQLGVLEKEEWLYRALKGRSILFSKDIAEKTTTLTYGGDVANCIANIIKDRQSYGAFINITSEESVKWIDIVNIYCEEIEEFLGRRPKVILQDLDQFLSWRGNIYQVKYDRMYDRVFKSKYSAEFLHIQFSSNILKLRECLRTFLRNPSFDKIDWGLEGRKDAFAGELASPYEIQGFKSKIKYLDTRFLSGKLRGIF
jgi:nucleoside-diphosphate-sugar epimerase